LSLRSCFLNVHCTVIIPSFSWSSKWLLLKLLHINFFSHPSEVHTFIGSVQEDTTRPLASTEQQPPENDWKRSVGTQYPELKPTGDSPDVSEHYQYCFRNSPYEDSSQQYRKSGNKMFCVIIEAFMACNTEVLGRQQHYG
jgi:hypothetical protein